MILQMRCISLTREQFALAAGADEKWIENSARQLGCQLARTPAEARWLGLVRLLARDFEIPIARAGKLAELSLSHRPATTELTLVQSAGSVVALVVNLARYHSTFIASLSAALHHATPRRRGRPATELSGRAHDPVADAAAYGVDVSLLRESLRRTPAELLQSLDEDVAFLADIRPVENCELSAAGRSP